ncbi:MAG TPA: hypothetical protein VEA59_03540 [Patescibacteria group bacterium]|nr:hypothetical protein [Patescibacteria group bacterium]
MVLTRKTATSDEIRAQIVVWLSNPRAQYKFGKWNVSFGSRDGKVTLRCRAHPMQYKYLAIHFHDLVKLVKAGALEWGIDGA